jgi:hypothetical protein
MSLPSLIYLDIEFITQRYEAIKGGRVPTKVVKKSNLSSSISGFFVNAGASMEETKEFPITSRMMYEKIHQSFGQLPQINIEKDKVFPELFWVEGVFSCSRPSVLRGSDEIAVADVFVFFHVIGKVEKLMHLVTNDTYFVSGYDRLLKLGYAITRNFAIHARILIRLLSVDKKHIIGAPMVILKTANVNVDVPARS